MPLGFDKVYNINRFWISNLAHVLTQVLMGITSTIVSPSTAFKSSVRQFSEALNAVTSCLQGVVKRVFISTGLALVTVWVSVLLYVCFYNFYVPTASLVRPAHFKFRACPDGSGICSFPVANITLCAPNCAEVLGTGQQYRVILQLVIPDSSSNRDAGMFMVRGRMYDQHGSTIQESSRAVAVKYQSDTLKMIWTVLLSPLYFTAFAEETQIMVIELFEDFRDDYYQPTIGVLLEVQSYLLTFYSAQLQFHACYAGLKYYLFYYPVSSAVCGITFNCLWLSAVFLLTWYRVGLGLLEGWLIRIGVSWKDEEAMEERMETHEYQNGGCHREQEDAEAVKNYIQPFTVTTSSKESETAGNVEDNSLHQPVPEAPSHQQEKPPSNHRISHVQPFTVGVAAAKETDEGKEEETTVMKTMKVEEDYFDNGELRQRKKLLKYW